MSAFIDPAESFSRALGQGLGTFKQYRDEARMDDEIAFNRKLALKAEERAVNADKRAADLHAIALDNNKYDVSRRPFREKVEQVQLEGFELNNEGQRIDNEWKPKLNAETIRSSKDSSARGWASIGIQRRQLALQEAAAAGEREERDSRNAMRLLVSAMQTNDYSVVQNNPRIGNLVLRMAGAGAGAPRLLEAMQNPTGSWLNDPKTKREVLNVAAIDLGKTAQNLGFKKGTVTVADIKPTKVKGMVDLEFVGLNPRTGRLEKRMGHMPAARLFDKASLFANTMHRISNDPKARTAMVTAFRESRDPLYGEMLDYEVTARQSAISDLKSKAKTEGLSDEESQILGTLQREVVALQRNDPNAVGAVIFPRMQKVGREFVTTSTSRAFRVTEARQPKAAGNTDALVVGINSVIDRAARDRKYYERILNSVGISPAGPFDPDKVLRAIGQ